MGKMWNGIKVLCCRILVAHVENLSTHDTIPQKQKQNTSNDRVENLSTHDTIPQKQKWNTSNDRKKITAKTHLNQNE